MEAQIQVTRQLRIFLEKGLVHPIVQFFFPAGRKQTDSRLPS